MDQAARGSCWAGRRCTTVRGELCSSNLCLCRGNCADDSFLDMVTACAEHFPTDIYGPPIASAAPPALSPITPQTNGSGISLRAGGYELSVGGTAGSGLYRSTQGDVAASFQLPPGATQVAEGIRDGAGRLWGNVRQKVEERVSRTGTPQGR